MSVAEKLAALAAKHGLESDEFEQIEGEYDDTPERVAFRGEAVLYALEYPLQPRVTKVCVTCGDPFQSYYKAVAHCSQECLVRELKKMGIQWRPDRNLRKERWEVRAEPKLIPLKALQAMKAIVAQAEADLGFQIALPEISAFVPASTYFPSRDPEKTPDQFQIALSPIPEGHSEELPPSLASSSPQEDRTSEDSAGTSSALAQEPEKSSPDDDPLEWLFAD